MSKSYLVPISETKKTTTILKLEAESRYNVSEQQKKKKKKGIEKGER